MGPRLVAFLSIGAVIALKANDYTAEIANGGLRARKETRVTMKSEHLFISEKKIRVEYEYLNDSDQDVDTEVAFPWPRYEYSVAKRTYEPSMLNFSVVVDGKGVPYETQIKAFLPQGKDITAVLRGMKLNIPLFAYYDGGSSTDPALRGHPYEVLALPKKDRQELGTLGAIEQEEDFLPLWEVEITHHWTQHFPAHRVVRVVHEYEPIVGGASTMSLENMAKPGQDTRDPGCPDAALQAAVERRDAAQHRESSTPSEDWSWIRYILTTANTWNGPIGDFALTVERKPGELVNFCWDGPVEKVGPNTFRARMKQFRPAKELTVYYRGAP